MYDSKTIAFISAKATAEVGTFPRALSIYPNGYLKGLEVQLMAPSNLTLSDQLAAADRILAAVQKWRSGIADEIQRTRTAEDELAEARAEIARLRGEGAQS